MQTRDLTVMKFIVESQNSLKFHPSEIAINRNNATENLSRKGAKSVTNDIALPDLCFVRDKHENFNSNQRTCQQKVKRVLINQASS
jgi:hypothetical protein